MALIFLEAVFLTSELPKSLPLIPECFGSSRNQGGNEDLTGLQAKHLKAQDQAMTALF